MQVRVKRVVMGRVCRVCATLLQSDIVQSYGRTTDTRTVGVGLRKKPKDLIASERNVVMGRVWVCMLLCFSQIQYSHMVS